MKYLQKTSKFGCIRYVTHKIGKEFDTEKVNSENWLKYREEGFGEIINGQQFNEKSARGSKKLFYKACHS